MEKMKLTTNRSHKKVEVFKISEIREKNKKKLDLIFENKKELTMIYWL